MFRPFTSTSGARKALTAIAALTFGAAVLAGCGSDDSASTTSPGAGSGTAGAAFPVTVEHTFGSTTVKKKPERIVTIGLSDHEPVLALGHKPVGVIDWFTRKPFTDWPWVKAAWGGTEPVVLGEREEGLKFEKLLSLKPDLIFAMYAGITKENYAKLSKVAPVVAMPKGFDPYAAPWQEYTKLAGRALGQDAKAAELIKGIDAKFAKVRQDNPQWQGKTAVAADTFKPGAYSAFQKSDPKSAFLTQLGFTVPEKINKDAGKLNVSEFGSEGLDVLDVDRLVWLTMGKEPQQRIKNDKVYQQLKVHKEGRDHFFTYENPPIGAALSFYTVLSIPYAIEQAVPLIKK
ncbi:iron-siderophore ABC transporter substrate-binding protein [Spirillospora sp. CA-294931]|uniref:iron-siderophore ABC transporter substrate-binding protein n=1 Tax=Spirillospora sp. CA-294931 TaxID=3240042 RepID=UPI003D91A9ED